MKIRLFLAALCLFLLPLFFTGTSSQFSAYAGGFISWNNELIPCECNEPGCTGGDCDATHSASQPPEKDASLGSESLIILAALMLWLRIRAN